MKILIATGAFKHSLSAQHVAEAVRDGFIASGLDASYHLLPIADGGNGTLDAFLANGGERVTIPAHDPLMRPIQADYGLINNGQTAVIEMATASGIELLTNDELNPLIATTYGTGELMQDAINRGATQLIIGLGGSATVDGGMGCLQALGIHLHDPHNEPIPYGGAGLAQLATVDTNPLDPRWQHIDIIIASDVDNPTLGEKGAARVFGPQKGADPNMVETLEENLNHCFTTIYQQTGTDVRNLRGGGAAGAFSAGLMAFLNCQVVSGIDLVLDHNHFVEHLADSDLVITGEGQMDSQTIDGKGPIGVARLAKAHGVPTIAFVGGLNVADSILHDAGIHAVFPVVDKPMPLDTALSRASELVKQSALRLGYVLQL
jgi:glycerate kinase